MKTKRKYFINFLLLLVFKVNIIVIRGDKMTIENIFLEELRRVISERPRGYQTEIAKALKINTSTFSNMICGRRGWEEDERRAVAKFVGLDYDHIARDTQDGRGTHFPRPRHRNNRGDCVCRNRRMKQ